MTRLVHTAAALIENSDLQVLAGQGHLAIDAAPELIASHVRETFALTSSG